MKNLAMLLLILVCAQCGSLQFDKNPPFQITSAVVQNWSGGQQGVQGKNLKISFLSKKTIEFDSVFFDKRSAKLQAKNGKEGKMVVGYFRFNEKKDLIIDENPVKELQNPLPALRKIPFQLKDNEAVISYKTKGSINYFKISDIKKEKEVFFPVAPN